MNKMKGSVKEIFPKKEDLCSGLTYQEQINKLTYQLLFRYNFTVVVSMEGMNSTASLEVKVLILYGLNFPVGH